MNNIKKTEYIALSLLVTGVAQGAVVDIGSIPAGIFDSSVDSLSNTTGITDLDSGNLFSEGSDFTGVDFAGLGISSWSFSTADNDSRITWDNANFSGLTVTLGGNNQFRSDSFVGTNFSDTTFNATGNQPFVTAGGLGLDLTGANFSGATFNLGSTTTLGFAVYSNAPGSLSGADFTNTVWNYTGAGNGASFSIGAGSTSTADANLAADFSGADFSGVTNLDNVITNLGGFDGGTAIGAKYDANTVLSNGFTTADLDAAGWQFVAAVPEPSSVALLGLGGLALILRRRK